MAIYYLSHAGVKGMKWGHRKARQATGGTSRGSASKPVDRGTRRASAGKKKSKGKRMAGRIVGGVLGNVAIAALGSGAQYALASRGHVVAATMVGYGATGMAVANTVKTVKDTVAIGRGTK
jgi:hypothetical protein